VHVRSDTGGGDNGTVGPFRDKPLGPGGRRFKYDRPVALDLYAGIGVNDYAAARAWYERLLGSEPTFLAHETEAVWELAEGRSIFVVQDPERAGHALHTIFVDDLESVVSEIASRGITPAERERYSNGVSKAIYRDADGNEIGFAGAPS
jgi:catechol 2,3-dioxygenase-like lactoylglutathione lyase family enzyme